MFQPTEDFQSIKEGQDIPPGLHVRLNIYTGEKEARLNIPMDGDDDPALEGIPVEQAMVVVDQPESESEEAKQIPIPPNAPAYEAVGKIQQPPPNSGDAVTFGSATLSIKTGREDFDTSLDDLSELAHDIYYGVEMCKDRPTVEKLLCYALGHGSEKFPATENRRDHKAASTLAAAIQNNPSALTEVTNLGKELWYPTCGTSKKAAGTEHFVEILRKNLEREMDPSALKAKVALMNGLMKNPNVRDDFVQAGAMKLLLAIWLQEGEQWEPARMNVAQVVMDTFLDENMGAELKIWPKGPASKGKVCESTDRRLDDGCWEHHVEGLLKTSPRSSWAKDFLKMLREQRANVAEPISHQEL
jgi:nucleotide exchange factor SIL1